MVGSPDGCPPKKIYTNPPFKTCGSLQESKQCYNIGSTAGWPVSDNYITCQLIRCTDVGLSYFIAVKLASQPAVLLYSYTANCRYIFS